MRIHIPSADERISAENILDATDMPVAKKGPEKNPKRLMATASVMIFGTLFDQQMQPRGMYHVQPEYQLQTKTQHYVDEDHASLAPAVGWLSQNESTKEGPSIKASRNIAHILEISISHVDEVLHNPSYPVRIVLDIGNITYHQR
jgi:hypothetical protein